MKKITSYPTRIIICIMLYGGLAALTYEFLSQGLTLPDQRTILYERLRRAGVQEAKADIEDRRLVVMAGLLDAEADIRGGRLVVMADGYEPDHITNYIILMKKRYGITYHVDSEYRDPIAADYWKAYNDRSRDEIISRYGIYIFHAVDTEAEELHSAGTDLNAEDILLAEGKKFWSERNEPYTITVDSLPPFPEDIFVKGASGTIRLRTRVSIGGTLTVEGIESIQIWNGPFPEEYYWPGYGSNSTRQDSIKRLIQPWLDRYIASMHIQVNPNNYRWIYQSNVVRTYTIDIGPKYSYLSPAIAHVPNAPAPNSVAGPRDRYQVDIACFLDSSGTMKSWKFQWIQYWKYLEKADIENPYVDYSCSAKNHFDASKVYHGDLFLIKRFMPWVKSVLARTTFDVYRKNDYFKYFGLGVVYVTLENENQIEEERRQNAPM